MARCCRLLSYREGRQHFHNYVNSKSKDNHGRTRHDHIGKAPTSSGPSTTVVSTTITSRLVDASSTITASTSTTLTVTAMTSTLSFLSVTTTSTVLAPAATFYAACDSTNRVTSIDGNILDDACPATGYTISSADSAYDWCATCVQTATCAVSIFEFGLSSGNCFSSPLLNLALVARLSRMCGSSSVMARARHLVSRTATVGKRTTMAFLARRGLRRIWETSAALVYVCA
jgi:hypothetical protein